MDAYYAKTTKKLTTLGLSKHEAVIYQILTKYGALSAADIAKELSVFPQAIYRLLDDLIIKGFVAELNTTPKSFQAVSANIAVEGYIKRKATELEQIKLQLAQDLSQTALPSPTKIQMISNAQEMYKTHIMLMQRAKKEVLIISIGEQVSDDVKLAHVNAVKRSAAIKLLVQNYNQNNTKLLKSWVSMKTDVRYFADEGYHMMIYDSAIAALVANNPENTAERSGIVFYNKGIANALREYFYSRWEKALVINKF